MPSESTVLRYRRLWAVVCREDIRKVSSEEWEQKTIEAIQKAAFTGEVGDGKIFSYEIRSAQKIRTGETGYDALQSND